MVTLVTGGSGSGKSAFAEQEIVRLGKRRRIYIATMKPWDEECRRRIERHRLMRADKQFETVECYRGLERLKLPAAGKDGELTGAAKYAVLLECLSNLVSNELFGTGEDDCPDSLSAEYGSAAADSVVDGILSLSRKVSDLVIVTNEVFSAGDYRKQPVCIKWDENGENPDTGDLCGWDESTALYLKVLGEINCRLGMLADRVIEVSAGIPVVIK
ncbi:bifunctional adenosylcobinamide kinase/adenosylcobinamide-phosphate guanylyltransferase [Hungatella hathewayi]|uniref:bifunctional adenosylcobinamide kinase/adenosylcobinamide-phosphate guanylyltransferase n=1 Tax=Hungatella hathewayi TaxID=154046 RepID=UPI0035634A1A